MNCPTPTTPQRDERGVLTLSGALLTDIAGNRYLGPGSDLFPMVFDHGVFVDKSMLVKDVASRPGASTLYCRPRRFGKTLAATMLRDFFECAPLGDPKARSRFERLSIWQADAGRWQTHQGRYPVVQLSLKGASTDTWETTHGVLAQLIGGEYERHGYLLATSVPTAQERLTFERIIARTADDIDLWASLRLLCDLLARHHDEQCIVIIDEYDAPITHARAHGFYDQAVQFMRTWLTNALKTNPSLAFGVLAGVQRISKESIFSGLNNIEVNTPLNQFSEERFGFTAAEVEALATYAGHHDKMAEIRHWYDGYRFGTADIYNPWSVLSYLSKGCVAQPYWVNTSGNSILEEALQNANPDVRADLLGLLNPGALLEQWIDPTVAYDTVATCPDALWSILYMSGYLTTDDTDCPEAAMRLRRLRVPNAEVRGVFAHEVADRARRAVGSPRRLAAFYQALTAGDAEQLQGELSSIAAHSASYYDLTSETSCHMLLLGLLFDIPGYASPLSNREAGFGRFDIALEPLDESRPPIIVEVKFMHPESHKHLGNQGDHALANLARQALGQITEKDYAASFCTPVLNWGIAFAGKRVAAAVERLETPAPS